MGANSVSPGEVSAGSKPRNPVPLRRMGFWSRTVSAPSANGGTIAAPIAPALIANSRLVISLPVSLFKTPGSKHQLHLYPHGANATIGKIAIQKAPGLGAIDAH